ncbi:putative AP-2 complex subunit alpha [Blattamonas nauphoetae]|uniref:AP-2 complex subunit alpha n=1 Tax=Blattamonas nauphoetae TaxID=2049346 RepID=A0ABQ9X248_9EUKA|nr:putative AP-2 complex subunit alpha [Blattamonas nauphoetae]
MELPYRGLTNFITELRATRTRVEEYTRVADEAHHIREVYMDKKNLDGYNKRKYSLKLMFITVMGFTADFGHLEAIELIQSENYEDKQIGYLTLSTFVNERSELLLLMNQSLLNDLTSDNRINRCLALTFIANCGNADTAEVLINNVAKILTDPRSSTFLLKKSALCVLHLYRKNPDSIQPEQWIQRIQTLLQHTDAGVLTALMSLLHGFAVANPNIFAKLIPHVCSLLYRVIISNGVTGDYVYNHIPAPWLIIKGLQFLQLYRELPDEKCVKDVLAVLKRIVNTDNKHFVSISQTSKAIKKQNAMIAVLFESINLAVKMPQQLPVYNRALQHVRAFLLVNDPDLRYLSLEAAASLCVVDPENTGNDPNFVAIVEKALGANDMSLKRRAIDVMFEMCSSTNSGTIVANMLSFLESSTEEIKEELSTKIAILAEKYPSGIEWYVDVMFRLLQSGGPSCPSSIWMRTAQIISSHEKMHQYAAETSAVTIRGINVFSSILKLCGYILGEWSNLVAADIATPEEIVNSIIMHLHETTDEQTSFSETLSVLLTSLSKIGVRHPSTRTVVEEELERHRGDWNSDSQETALGFRALIKDTAEEAPAVFLNIPTFPVKESILLKDLKKKEEEKGVVVRESHHLKGLLKQADWEDDEAEINIEQPPSPTPTASPLISSQPGQPAPSKPSEPEASKDDTLIDFGDMLLDMGSSQKQASPTTQPEQSNTDLISSLFGSFGPGPTQPVAQAPMNKERVLSLLVSGQGLLWENQDVGVHVKHQYTAGEGRAQLAFTNKTTNLLCSVSVAVDTSHPLAPPESALTVQLQPMAGNQISSTPLMLNIVLLAQGGFTNPPILTFSYIQGLQTTNASFFLPSPPTSFFSVPSPAPSSEIYNNMWNQFKQQPNRATHKIISTRSPLNPALLQSIIGLLQSTYHFHLLPGYSSNKQVICLVSALALKNKTPIPVLLTLQPHMDNGNVNVAFDYASPSPEVVNGLSDWMIGQISDL